VVQIQKSLKRYFKGELWATFTAEDHINGRPCSVCRGTFSTINISKALQYFFIKFDLDLSVHLVTFAFHKFE